MLMLALVQLHKAVASSLVSKNPNSTHFLHLTICAIILIFVKILKTPEHYLYNLVFNDKGQ